MTRPLVALLGPALLALLAAPTPAPAQPTPPVYHDVAGVLCLEAERATNLNGWTPGNYYTGVGLRARPATGSADYHLEIREPGTYRVHLLAARHGPIAGPAESVRLSLSRDGASFTPAATIRLAPLRAPAWTDQAAEPSAAELTFPSAGPWTLRLSAAAGEGFFLDKLVLSARGYVPTGTGPAETTDPTRDVTALSAAPEVVLPPAWAFGVLYGGYTDQRQTLATLDQLAAGGYPVDAYWIDSWFWDFANEGRGPGGYLRFEEDKTAFPDIAAMWAEFSRRHIKAGVWIWDCILREGNEQAFDDFRSRGFLGEPFIERDGWHNQTKLTISANINFENPAAVAYWKQRLAPFFAAGLDFLKIDRSSAIPFTRAAFEAAQQLGRETRGRGFVLAHLHTTHDPRHLLYPTKWSGDAKIAWAQPDYPDLSRYAMGAFRENIGMVADPRRSTYSIPFLAHDAGGYDVFNDGALDDELYARWVQFSAFAPVTTLFSFSKSTTRNHPHAYPAAIQDAVRPYLQLRLRLFPYLYSHALAVRLAGERLIRGDAAHPDQFLFGSALLVAPVTTPGATTRTLHLPVGTWFKWHGRTPLEGGREITVDAPLAKLPLFVRAGAIVPLRDFAPSVEAGTNAHLTLEIYPGADGTFTLREDDGTSDAYLTGGFATTELRYTDGPGTPRLTLGALTGDFDGRPTQRRWTIRLHAQAAPRAAALGGRALATTFDAAAGVVTCEFEAPTASALQLEWR